MRIKFFITILLAILFPSFVFADTWFPSGSPTDLTPVVSSWGLKVPGIPGGAGCLERDSAGVVTSIGSNCSSGGSSFGYPFPLAGNATSTLTQFNGGITAFASSTIGDGTQAGGLTVSGGATTTGNAYFASNVGVSTTSPGTTFAVGGNVLVNGAIQTDEGGLGTIKASGSVYAGDFYRNTNNNTLISLANDNVALYPGGEQTLTAQFQCCTYGNVGIASSSPWGRLAVDTSNLSFPIGVPEFNVGSPARQDFIIDQAGHIGVGATSTPGSLFSINNVANFTTGTSTFYGNGLSITNGCFAIGVNCISLSNLSGQVSLTSQVSGILPVANGGTNSSALSNSSILSFNGTSIVGTSTPTAATYLATSTTATSTFAGGFNVANINQTGTATSTNNWGITIANGCYAINNTCIGLGTLSGTVTVPHGGTGQTSLSGGQVLYGNGTGNVGTAATSSLSAGSGIAISNAAASFVIGGSSPSFSLAPINAGVLGAAANSTVPTSQATSTLYGGASTGGFVLQWSNTAGGLILAATSSSGGTVTSVNNGSTGSTLTFSGGPITTSGTINGEINLTHSNIWTALQISAAAGTTTFAGGIESPLVGAAQFAATSSTATSTFAGGFNVANINQTGSATSTLSKGITLASGCFAKNNTCITSASLAFIFSTSTPSTATKPVTITFTGTQNSSPAFTFAAAPTLVLPSNTAYIIVELNGAGGGGDGTDNTAGGGGGYIQKVFNPLGTKYFFDVGAGGTGNGGNTAFGTGSATSTANGGSAGSASGPGAGGNGTTADVILMGSAGESTNAVSGSTGGTGAKGGGGGAAGAANNGAAFGGGGATTGGGSGTAGKGGSGGVIISVYTSN